MGYYPIKCIYCMEPVRMEDRCVKLDPEEIKTFNSRFEKKKESEDIVLNDNATKIFQNTRNKNKKIEYKSLAKLREEKVIEREETLKINLSKEFQRIEECRKDFVNKIHVKDMEINGEKFSGYIDRFYCPFCNEEITPLAGTMPMYLVSLLGPSSAGKTVYLTILHMILSGKEYPLPQGYLTFDKYGNTGNEIQKFALNLLRKNELPGTTTESRKTPYLLKVNYVASPNSGEINKQCLLGLIDMRGEMLQGLHNEELKTQNVPTFKNSNGFIMLVDPETLEGVYHRLPEQSFGGREIEQLDMTLGFMKEAIMQCITAEMGKINQPSVVALAKEDILLKNYAQLGIPLTQPVIAPQFRPVLGTYLGQNYYEPMNRSTRECIRYLSGSFTTFLDNTFTNPYFVSVSALGSTVQIKGNNIDNFEKIRPVRVEEPLLRLLMDFNFIPPFYREEYYRAPMAVMEKWGEVFAENWSGIQSNTESGKNKK